MGKKVNSKRNQDDVYDPKRRPKANKLKKAPSKNSDDINMNSSIWNQQQNFAFMNFLKTNTQMIECPLKRKEQKVFLRLSQIIKTRSPDQCRSHHQKMIKYHRNVAEIISHLEIKLKNTNFFEDLQPQIKIQDDPKQMVKKQQVQEISLQNLQLVSVQSYEVKEELWDCLREECWVNKPEEQNSLSTIQL